MYYNFSSYSAGGPSSDVIKTERLTHYLPDDTICEHTFIVLPWGKTLPYRVHFLFN